MESHGVPPSSSGQLYLTTVLCLLLGGPIYLVLATFTSDGLSLALALMAGSAIAWLHYFVWGRALDKEVAREREELNRTEAIAKDAEV